jgi:glycosyltransferase involved in cell wall biosynthesis
VSSNAAFKPEVVHTQSIPAVGRNEPCPCGSGRRYKDCHGTLGAPAPTVSDGRLADATQRLRAGDIDGAEAMAREILSARPGNADALHILGLCAYERGRVDEALRALLAAAKALPTPARPERKRLWADLEFVFLQALSGIDSSLAAARRAEYAQWLAVAPDRDRGELPLVSIVLVVVGSARWLERSVESVCGQTYGRLELIVMDGTPGGAMTQRLDTLLSGCRLPHRLLSRPGIDEPGLINEGVRASTGTYLNILHVDDEFAPERIASLVEKLAMRGTVWGFSGVDFIDAGSDMIPDDAPILREWRELPIMIAESDTVGYSFIHRDYVAVAIGNLFFSRAVFELVGGMRALAHTYAWDFCLRALWHEEPEHVAATLYRHRIAVSADAPTPRGAGSEPEQLAMFREFYARASDEREQPPNRFAPSVHYWRTRFFKAPFHVGHVSMFSLKRLETLVDEIGVNRQGRTATRLTPGLNLIGFAFGEFGLGESLRAFVGSCMVGKIPFIVKDVDMRVRARQADQSVAAHISRELQHRCSLFCLNPDAMQTLLPLAAATKAAGGRAVGYWYWELEDLPREWDYALETVDEIWVPTEFVAGAMRRSTTKPVVKIPPPIEVKLSRVYRRSDFRLPEDRFLFLFFFDFNSFVRRKNPDGPIAAFKRAFGAGRSDVGLVIKSINGGHRPERMRALEDLIAGDDRIIIKDEFLNRDQVSGLESVVDAFVSLHRGEGLGLGLAESMYLGKPVIGTAYSGNLEFMNHENSCLVDYELIAVRKGDYLYDDERFRWADPDIGHAAHYMLRVADDAEFRNRIASRGQRDVRSRFTPAATATLLRRRLLELGLI